MDDFFAMGDQPQPQPEIFGINNLMDIQAAYTAYISAKAPLNNRILSAENWWRLRNTVEESKESELGDDGGYVAKSAWLHNVIVSKHADAMDSFPAPTFLPREESDKGTAEMLSSIVPCIYDRCGFRQIYSKVQWQKLKTGTGVYKITWDPNLLGGMGDISIQRINLLNLTWQPGIEDIQDSKYLFHAMSVYLDDLKEQYPDKAAELSGTSLITPPEFPEMQQANSASDKPKVSVVDCYYHKNINGIRTLQLCKFCGSTILYATENDPNIAERGLYDHCMYPFVFDVLFPIEDSPAGEGYTDICRSPQTSIDILNTAIIKNSVAGAMPRWLSNTEDSKVNATELLDLNNPIVHYSGSMDDLNLRPIDSKPLPGGVLNVVEMGVQELRETSGNTEVAAGAVPSGVTAASAIAALQEASGKTSRDSTATSYEAFKDLTRMVLALIKQFYNEPRQFRILGPTGGMDFVTFDNQGLLDTEGPVDPITGMADLHSPDFDITIGAQKKSAYTTIAQNELALQLYSMGLFAPQAADQALMCLDMMDFDGKETLMQKIQQNSMLMQMAMQYAQIAASMDPLIAEQAAADMMAITGGMMPNLAGAEPEITEGDNLTGGTNPEEHTRVQAARQQADSAPQPR